MSFSLSECDDGDVRLSSGTSSSSSTSLSLEGRVEICKSNSYYRVCDDLWDEKEARVVCRQLSYTGSGQTISIFEGIFKVMICIFVGVVAIKKSNFTVGNSSEKVEGVFNEALLCDGTEDNLLQCDKYIGDGGGKRCPNDYSEDAGVICNGEIKSSLNCDYICTITTNSFQQLVPLVM